MPTTKKQFRFAFIGAFTTPAQEGKQPKEKTQQLQNWDMIKHLLDDVEWDAYPGGVVQWGGDWPAENREELLYAAAARLPVVHKLCESGKYNAIILLGGADPGFLEAREIAHKYHIALTTCGHASMTMACSLGHKFSIIYMPSGLPRMHQIVSTYYYGERCASIRHLSIHLPRPGYKDAVVLDKEKQKALAGKRSEAVERAVVEAVDAIENDGADVITFGCSGLYWLTPFLQKRLDALKWDVPVLDGYTCAILQAKSLVALGHDCAGLTWPPDRPEKERRKKLY